MPEKNSEQRQLNNPPSEKGSPETEPFSQFGAIAKDNSWDELTQYQPEFDADAAGQPLGGNALLKDLRLRSSRSARQERSEKLQAVIPFLGELGLSDVEMSNILGTAPLTAAKHREKIGVESADPALRNELYQYQFYVYAHTSHGVNDPLVLSLDPSLIVRLDQLNNVLARRVGITKLLQEDQAISVDVVSDDPVLQPYCKLLNAIAYASSAMPEEKGIDVDAMRREVNTLLDDVAASRANPPTSVDSLDQTVRYRAYYESAFSTIRAMPDAALINKIADVCRWETSNLTSKEREVLKLRFGLDGQLAQTLEEIANHYGLTRERVRQIEAKTLRKLRHPTRFRPLVPYFSKISADRLVSSWNDL